MQRTDESNQSDAIVTLVLTGRTREFLLISAVLRVSALRRFKSKEESGLARQVRVVFARALGASARLPAPLLRCSTGAEGLSLQAQALTAATAYHQPGRLPSDDLSLPLDALRECGGGSQEPVTPERQGGEVLIQWTDRGIPQQRRFGRGELSQPFPTLPTSLTANDPRRVRVFSSRRVASRAFDGGRATLWTSS